MAQNMDMNNKTNDNLTLIKKVSIITRSTDKTKVAIHLNVRMNDVVGQSYGFYIVTCHIVQVL